MLQTYDEIIDDPNQKIFLHHLQLAAFCDNSYCHLNGEPEAHEKRIQPSPQRNGSTMPLRRKLLVKHSNRGLRQSSRLNTLIEPQLNIDAIERTPITSEVGQFLLKKADNWLQDSTKLKKVYSYDKKCGTVLSVINKLSSQYGSSHIDHKSNDTTWQTGPTHIYSFPKRHFLRKYTTVEKSFDE